MRCDTLLRCFRIKIFSISKLVRGSAGKGLAEFFCIGKVILHPWGQWLYLPRLKTLHP